MGLNIFWHFSSFLEINFSVPTYFKIPTFLIEVQNMFLQAYSNF